MDQPQQVQLYMQKMRGEDVDCPSPIPSMFVKIGRPAVQPLIDALDDNNPTVRWMCAHMLGYLGDTRAVQPLMGCLTNSDESTRSCAAVSLGRLNDNRAVQPLLAVMENSAEDEIIRGFAAQAVGEIGTTMAALRRTWRESRSQYVRFAAAAGLAKAGDEPAFAFLRRALLGDHTRLDAIRSLEWLADERSVDALLEVLVDSDEHFQASVILALGQIKNEKALGALVEVLGTDGPNHDLACIHLKRISGEDFGTDYEKWRAWLKTR